VNRKENIIKDRIEEIQRELRKGRIKGRRKENV
jgi:hypothetical protein